MNEIEPPIILQTSGTEGVPKQVSLSHETFRASARIGQTMEQLQAGDCWLNCLPQHHVGGLAIRHRCELAGATMLLHHGFDLQKIQQDLEQHAVTHLSLVPVMLSKLLNHYGERVAPASLRTILIGGDRLPKPLAQRAVDQGWPLVVSYGMTETASRIAMLRLTRDNIEAWQEGEVGPPLPGVELSISEAGAIEIRCEALFPGEDRTIHTRDRGYLDRRGHLHVQGRLDYMILTGGELVDPVVVEQRLLECPWIEDAGVTAVPDLEWGEQIVAVVQHSGTLEQIEAWSQQLPGHLRPRRWIDLQQLKKSAIGKIDRKWLRTIVH